MKNLVNPLFEKIIVDLLDKKPKDVVTLLNIQFKWYFIG